MYSMASNDDKDLYKVKCHIRAQCTPPPLKQRESYFLRFDLSSFFNQEKACKVTVDGIAGIFATADYMVPDQFHEYFLSFDSSGAPENKKTNIYK